MSGSGPAMETAFKEVFDGCVDHYATERERLPYFRAQIKIMQSMLSGESAGTVLDIGCAAGSEVPALRAMGHKVIAADFSERMVQVCKRRFAEDAAVQVLCAPADRLPLSDGSVDHVVCLGVFEYLPDYSPALSEIARVLRPNGLLVLAVPTAISAFNVGELIGDVALRPLWRMAMRAVGRKPKSSGAEPRTNLCLPWRLRKQLRAHGLDTEHDAYTNFFLYPLDRFPSIDVKVAALLEPLASVPFVKLGASVYLVSGRRR
ncbi:MAG TPA: class I SAM-dependent methyltransferase [Candidatus Bathyarchaeia archaeon]|nr:class I SAM-dependent methyltransferase [Candidatus Bathyarchaeia archaeon]